MPRFSIKDLLLAITLVSIGLSLETLIFRTCAPKYLGTGLSFAAIVCGPVFIGAGLIAPFYRIEVGAVIGFVVGALLAMYVLAMSI
jgi:hypothetical protein